MVDIHGKCGYFYCDQCMKSNDEVKSLEIGCENWTKFNPYKYKGYVKEMKKCL